MARKFAFTLILLAAAISSAAAQDCDFTLADQLCRRGEGNDYSECRKLLVEMLPKAQDASQKADVLWRLSKVCVVLGEKEPTKEGKRKVFGEGISHGEQAIAQDPQEPQGYMWHCANIGRECQTHNLMEQAASVKPMLDDLAVILDKLGRTDCSEAWQAKAEIYYNHPFKSNDEAIKYATKAVNTIPKDELRIQTYVFLAKMLWERNSSASKLGSELSDREQARQLTEKAMNLYRHSTSRTASDKRDYDNAAEFLSKMK